MAVPKKRLSKIKSKHRLNLWKKKSINMISKCFQKLKNFSSIKFKNS